MHTYFYAIGIFFSILQAVQPPRILDRYENPYPTLESLGLSQGLIEPIIAQKKHPSDILRIIPQEQKTSVKLFLRSLAEYELGKTSWPLLKALRQEEMQNSLDIAQASTLVYASLCSLQQTQRNKAKLKKKIDTLTSDSNALTALQAYIVQELYAGRLYIKPSCTDHTHVQKSVYFNLKCHHQYCPSCVQTVTHCTEDNCSSDLSYLFELFNNPDDLTSDTEKSTNDSTPPLSPSSQSSSDSENPTSERSTPTEALTDMQISENIEEYCSNTTILSPETIAQLKESEKKNDLQEILNCLTGIYKTLKQYKENETNLLFDWIALRTENRLIESEINKYRTILKNHTRIKELLQIQHTITSESIQELELSNAALIAHTVLEQKKINFKKKVAVDLIERWESKKKPDYCLNESCRQPIKDKVGLISCSSKHCLPFMICGDCYEKKSTHYKCFFCQANTTKQVLVPLETPISHE